MTWSGVQETVDHVKTRDWRVVHLRREGYHSGISILHIVAPCRTYIKHDPSCSWVLDLPRGYLHISFPSPCIQQIPPKNVRLGLVSVPYVCPASVHHSKITRCYLRSKYGPSLSKSSSDSTGGFNASPPLACRGSKVADLPLDCRDGACGALNELDGG